MICCMLSTQRARLNSLKAFSASLGLVRVGGRNNGMQRGFKRHPALSGLAGPHEADGVFPCWVYGDELH